MRTRIQGQKLWHSLLILFLLSSLLAILSACVGAPATEAPAAPVAPEEPAQPVEPGEELPVTYGQDSRIEVFQHTDAKLQEMAASVAIFVHKDQVKISGNSVTLQGYTLNEMSERGWLVSGANAPMCTGELFTSQTAPGFCTGFLVKEDVLVTAGHCLEKTACADTSIIFGFRMESNNSMVALTRDNVFKCAEVIAQETPKPENQYLDYAIIKLDRPTRRAGLDYVKDDHLEDQDRVAVLGYPSGLPMKIASDGSVISNRASDPFFVANLDTFGSNSGSPVINTDTYQVEGIVVRGMPDYVLSEDGSCVQVNRCPDSGGVNCSGENATKMGGLEELIPESTSTDSDGIICLSNLLFVLIIIAIVQLKAS
jgi:V8-like Glu-specific endopeptidase